MAKQLTLLMMTFLGLQGSVLASATEASLWTDRPIRIDPSTQQYERLPPRQDEGGRREWLSFPPKLKMHDAVHFSVQGKEYLLAGVGTVSRERMCSDIMGARWPCGRTATIFVRNLLRARHVSCVQQKQDQKILLIDCHSNGKNVIEEIISSGNGYPTEDKSRYEILLEKTKRGKVGIWKDDFCLSNDGKC